MHCVKKLSWRRRNDARWTDPLESYRFLVGGGWGTQQIHVSDMVDIPPEGREEKFMQPAEGTDVTRLRTEYDILVLLRSGGQFRTERMTEEEARKAFDLLDPRLRANEGGVWEIYLFKYTTSEEATVVEHRTR